MKKKVLFLMLPSLVGFFAIYIIPFIYSLSYSFTDNAFKMNFIGINNYIKIWQNNYFQLAIKNTFIFTLVSVPLIMIYSMAVALIMVYIGKKYQFLKNIVFLPVILPSASIAIFWNIYFDSMNPMLSLIIIYVWKYSGLNVMVLLSALTNVDSIIYDAANIDGASFINKALNITIPNIMPSIFFTFILSLVNSFKIYSESFLLYGNYPDNSVYMIQNYLNNHFLKLNYQNISTAACIFALIVYSIVAVLLIIEKKWSNKIW